MNKYGAHLLFMSQIIAHLGLLFGVFNFSMSDCGIVFLIYSFTSSVGMSITFHRLLSHGSFIPRRGFEVIGTLAGIYGLTGSSIAWVNNHRAHHKFNDTEKDPHSPKHLGYAKVQWLSMFSSNNSLRFIKVLRKDNFHVFLHRYYFLIHGIILGSFLTMFGLHNTCVFYLAPAAVLWNLGSCINTVCHSWFGYKNYEIDDTSKNNLLLGIIMWGEGYHNNHHAHPGLAKYGHKWYELDLSWYLIKILQIKSNK
jgi:fatty-acid desaturase